jgi:hypothetical protein
MRIFYLGEWLNCFLKSLVNINLEEETRLKNMDVKENWNLWQPGEKVEETPSSLWDPCFIFYILCKTNGTKFVIIIAWKKK